MPEKCWCGCKDKAVISMPVGAKRYSFCAKCGLEHLRGTKKILNDLRSEVKA